MTKILHMGYSSELLFWKIKHVLETNGHKKNPGGINMESSCNVKYTSAEGDVAPAWTKVKDKDWRELF